MNKGLLTALTFAIILLSAVYVMLSFITHNIIVGSYKADAEASIEYYNNTVITLTFPEGSEQISLRDVATWSSEFNDAPFMLVLVKLPSQTITIEWNAEDVRNAVAAIYEEPIPSDLEFSQEGGWALTKERNSRAFDIEAVVDQILRADPITPITVDVTEYMKPSDYDYTELQEQYDSLRKYNDFVITYTDGTTLTGKDIFASFDDAFNPNFEEFDLSDLKSSLLASYDTSGGILDFTTTGGEIISVPYKTFGKKLNWDEEKKIIQNAMTTGESLINRTPSITGYDSFSSSYVEISIEDQHVWHYVDGKLCCDTDCVTGTKNRHDTPTGMYYVSERISGKYLTGDDYKTWVDQWMRLTNSGIGLHDAYWRNKFGGNVFVNNGSHGCINLPPAYAKNLFSELTNGYPVIIY